MLCLVFFIVNTIVLSAKILLIIELTTNISHKSSYVRMVLVYNTITLIANIDKHLKDAPTDVKMRLIRSMFPEKLAYDGNSHRTGKVNSMLDVIVQQTRELRGYKKKKATELVDSVAFVPLTEPFSNNFMEDLEKIWELRTFIPDPTTPPVLYRNSDAEDVD